MTTSKKNIILLGGGGHAKVLIELIRLSGKYKIEGILDSRIETGALLQGVSVLGKDDLLQELYEKGVENSCIGMGSVKNCNKRKELYEKVKQIGFSVPYLTHPKAITSESVQISEGAQIMAGAIVQAGSFIGRNTIVNTGAIIEHDCRIGENVHICPGVVISGGSIIGDNSFIGAGATIIHCVKIGKDTVVGAGAMVIKDVSDDSKVIGVPAR